MNYFVDVIKKYAVFEGRARRKEYWMFQLFAIIFSLGLFVIDMVLGTFGVLNMIFSVFILVPSIAVIVRRLHDIGKSGAWFFISFIPLIGGIWLLILVCTDSEQGSNMYGANPKLQEN